MAGVGLTLGGAPWVLAALGLATIVVLIAGLASERPGRLARRAAIVFILMLIPAGLQAYVYYPSFLHAYNPRYTILPLTHASAWHPSALTHWPQVGDYSGQYRATRRAPW